MRVLFQVMLTIVCTGIILICFQSHEEISLMFEHTSFQFKNVFNFEKWESFSKIIAIETSVVFAILFWKSTSLNFRLSNLNRFTKIKYWIPFHEYPIVIIFFALTVLVRLFFLFQPIRYDEAFTFFEFGQSPPFYSFINYTYPNNHILHSWVAWLSTHIFGDNLIAIRLPAFIGGISTLIFTYKIAAFKHGYKVGAMAMALVGFCHFLIIYSGNARGYSLQTAIFLLTIHYIQKKKFNKISILSFLGFAISPNYILEFISIISLLLFSTIKIKKTLIIVSKAALFSILYYIPALSYVGFKTFFQNPNLESIHIYRDVLTSIEIISKRIFPFSNNGIIGQMILCFSLILISINKKWRNITIISFSGWIGLILITKTNLPPRVFQFCIPIIVILLTWKLSKLLNQFNTKHLIIGLFIILGSWFSFHKNWFDYEKGIQEVPFILKKIKKKDQEKIVSKLPLDYPIRYYLSRNELNFTNTTDRKEFIIIISPYYNLKIEDFIEVSEVKSTQTLAKTEFLEAVRIVKH